MNRIKSAVSSMLLSLILFLSSCAAPEPNGRTERMGSLLMVMDCTDPYLYVGYMDYVFAGTVEEVRAVLPRKNRKYEDSFSRYVIRVDRNIKGELKGEVVCSKMGGMKRDGTLLLVEMELPDGTAFMDSGLPEKGKSYVFMAYAQPDGSLQLSELFDDRPCTEGLIAEYREYADNEIPCDRERFTSVYDAGYAG